VFFQALHSMGYNRSAAELEAESGLQLHSNVVSKLQTAVSVFSRNSMTFFGDVRKKKNEKENLKMTTG
jgi:hypothetical protein